MLAFFIVRICMVQIFPYCTSASHTQDSLLILTLLVPIFSPDEGNSRNVNSPPLVTALSIHSSHLSHRSQVFLILHHHTTLHFTSLHIHYSAPHHNTPHHTTHHTSYLISLTLQCTTLHHTTLHIIHPKHTSPSVFQISRSLLIPHTPTSDLQLCLRDLESSLRRRVGHSLAPP